MNRLKNCDKVNMVVYMVFAVFFGYFLITGDSMRLGDSYQHENQFVTREPVYALLIQVLRSISQEHYLDILIAIQAMLAVIANGRFVTFLRVEYKISDWALVPIVLILLSPHIFTPLASSTHMVITNSIMTEGITYSLYLFLIKYLLLMLHKREILEKNSIITLALSLLLSLIRGQFMVMFIVWLIVALAFVIVRKQYRKIVVLLVAFCAVFVGRTYILKTYNYLEQGLFVGTASGKAMSVANVLYVCDKEDGEAIQDEGLRKLFNDIFDAAYADKMNYSFAPDRLIAGEEYFEDCHEPLNFDYFSIFAREYIREQKGVYVDDYQRLMVEQDIVASELMGYLMPEVIGRYVSNYVGLVIVGFIRSIAFVHPLLNIYSLVVYLTALILTVFLWRKDKTSMLTYDMPVILLIICGNVTGTALMIQCISRYMLYNLPIFYIIMFLMLYRLFGLNNKA